MLLAWVYSHTCPLDKVVAAGMRLGLAVPVECTCLVGSYNPALAASDGCQGGDNLDDPYAVVAVAEGDLGVVAVGHCSGVE